MKKLYAEMITISDRNILKDDVIYLRILYIITLDTRTFGQ